MAAREQPGEPLFEQEGQRVWRTTYPVLGLESFVLRSHVHVLASSIYGAATFTSRGRHGLLGGGLLPLLLVIWPTFHRRGTLGLLQVAAEALALLSDLEVTSLGLVVLLLEVVRALLCCH